MDEGKFNIISTLQLSLVELKIYKRSNKWKSILNKRKQHFRGLNTESYWIIRSDTILDHQVTQKFKLMGEDKFNIILSNKSVKST